MLQPYPETLDNIQIIKANPGNKWVRSPAQKNCQLMAVGLHRADQNLNAALGFRREASSSIVLAQGPLSHFGHGQEGSKAEETAVVRFVAPSQGLEPRCPSSLALTARGATAGRNCHVALANHHNTSWALQLSEMLRP